MAGELLYIWEALSHLDSLTGYIAKWTGIVDVTELQGYVTEMHGVVDRLLTVVESNTDWFRAKIRRKKGFKGWRKRRRLKEKHEK